MTATRHCHQLRKTKIVATIGPACDSPEKLEQMLRAGMNVARLNLSHGTFEGHQRMIGKIFQDPLDLAISSGKMQLQHNLRCHSGHLTYLKDKNLR